MDAAVAGIVGAAVGAAASIVGQVLAGRHQQQLEKLKAERARQDVVVKDVRVQAAEVGRFVLSLLHSADWLTWHARYDPAALTKELLGQYQKEAHESMPRLMAAITILDSLDPDLAAHLYPLAGKVSELDGKIGMASAGFDGDPDAVREALLALIPDVMALRTELRPALGAAMPGPAYRGPRQRQGFETRT